ncbi:ExbD/TolR family protein [Pseudomaricurvus albidus]|uniref:ExbD/TolR family protein n=1 Tax=Pseudomaricurvus albidus TaxID=2842452 RepID=UPI0034E25805
MRRRKGRGAEEDNSEIDLTPMLDVVFIMLIFFIVTASFVKESTIDVNMPDPNENQQQTDDDNAAIVVTVKANDEIWMDDRRIDIRAVRANIERVHAEKPQAPVVVKADANSTAKVFVAVADAAREAKVYNVSLLPPEEKK